MERAIILSTDGVIHSYHLPRNLQTSDVVVRPEPEGGSFNAVVGNVEREIIIEELKNSRGNMAKAARALGLTERVMGLRIVKYAINPRQFK